MNFEIIYEDDSLLVVDKPAGLITVSEKVTSGKTLAGFLIERFPYLKKVGTEPRYGIVHRLDKNTSGIVLVAKNNESLFFLQEQFKKRQAKKKYIGLVVGKIAQDRGEIKTLIGRSPKDRRKQKAFLPFDPAAENKRLAITEYSVLERFGDYTLLELRPKTGRKHQIRCHMVFINHPIAGDILYGFKNQALPEGLKRQFLHASYLKLELPDNKIKEFVSELPADLKNVLEKIRL